MPTVIANSPELRSPKAIGWTRADCVRMGEAGLLPDKYELVVGEVISKMGQNLPHALAVTLVSDWLTQVFGRGFAITNTSIDVAPEDNPTSEPEPDVTVLGMSAFELRGNPLPADIQLLLEVPDTTLRYDLSVKRDLYARARIPEYWVLDLRSKRFHIFRDPAEGTYRSHETREGDQRITAPGKPEAAISVSALLD